MAAIALAFIISSSWAAEKLEKLSFDTASGSHEFMVEVARTAEERQVGLMYRRSLPAEQGMLFDFGRAEPISMWMQNTYVSLDMVFIGTDGRVIRIEERTEPLSTRVIPSGRPARYVVELLAGTAARIGLKPGDRTTHPQIRG